MTGSAGRLASSLRRHAVPIAFAAALTAGVTVVFFPLLPSHLSLHEGDIASQTIRAPRDLTFTSQVLTDQRKEEAARAVPEVRTYDTGVRDAQLQTLQDLIARISSVRDNPALPADQRVTELNRIGGLQLTPSDQTTLLQLSATRWQIATSDSVRVLGSVLQDGFGQDQVESKRASVIGRVNPNMSPAEQTLVADLVRPLVVPTQVVDVARTARAEQQARDAVPPQQVRLSAGQVIVRDGDKIGAGDIEALRAAGMLDVRFRWNNLLAAVTLAAAVSVTLAVAMWRRRGPRPGWREWVTLGVIIVAMVGLMKLYLPLVLPDTGRRFLAFGLPVAIAPMLAASLFDGSLAITVAAVVALLGAFAAVYLPDLSGVRGLPSMQPVALAASYFLGGFFGAHAVRRAERLSRYFFAAVAIAAAAAVPAFAFFALDPARSARDAGWILLACSVGGILAAVLTVGAFALLGTVFNFTTRLQLMEISQMSAPLLRRLQEEAPGTFHHSIIVGNLAERAAARVGADPLLVRVGAYYHDVGKLAEPIAYIENQLSGENPHDALSPQESARLIIQHVRYGTDLARRYRLPDRVRAFVPEHHGTRLVAYFYRKAALDDPRVDPAPFIYPGPRPQSRETAIVMMSDSVEAVVRASSDRSPERIAELVEGVIAERLAEGQLDDCDLTLRDLRAIAESFKASLRAIYHPRVPYPAPTALERERGALIGALAGEGESPARVPVPSAEAAAAAKLRQDPTA